ncbi:MAG: hypothetical protein HY686_05090 [Chloroflexi bacterium]|nr:hypothetical protein [Chloroflexota bacterium]
MKSKVTTLQGAAFLVGNGAYIAMTGGGLESAPMALLRELLRQGRRGLCLVGVTGGGINMDLLIGAGAVRELEVCHLTIGEAGAGPNFRRAVEAGRLPVKDNT